MALILNVTLVSTPNEKTKQHTNNDDFISLENQKLSTKVTLTDDCSEIGPFFESNFNPDLDKTDI